MATTAVISGSAEATVATAAASAKATTAVEATRQEVVDTGFGSDCDGYYALHNTEYVIICHISNTHNNM